MSRLRPGDIVKVLVGGYEPLVEGEEGVVMAFEAEGAVVQIFEYGLPTRQGTAPLYALKEVRLIQAEKLWQKLRGNEPLILKAMRAWGVVRIAFEATGLVDEPLCMIIERGQSGAISLRTKTVAEALKQAFLLAYFARAKTEVFWKAREAALTELEAFREAVRCA